MNEATETAKPHCPSRSAGGALLAAGYDEDTATADNSCDLCKNVEQARRTGRFRCLKHKAKVQGHGTCTDFTYFDD